MVFRGFFFDANKVAVEDIGEGCKEEDDTKGECKGKLGKGVGL